MGEVAGNGKDAQRSDEREANRVLWVSYLRPEGFDVNSYCAPDIRLEHLRSGAEADDWAARNPGARVGVIVIVAAYMPGLDYDPSAILKRLRDNCRTLPFVIVVRENGPLFRLSHYAFTAEFREICRQGSTLILEEDSLTLRLTRPGEGRAAGHKPDGKATGGVSLSSRWDTIALRAVALARGGRVEINPPAAADEAVRLVQAMYERGSRKRPGTLGLVHKRMMVALSLPGASMRSSDLADLLHVTKKDITNNYGAIAFAVRGDAVAEAHADERGASDFCKRLGRDYQDWLISFGARKQLLPEGYR